MKRIFWAFPLAVLASYSTIGWAEAKYIYPPSVHECALAAKAEPSVAPPAWPDQGQQTVAGRTAITLEAMQSALNKMGMCNPDVIILRADGLNLDRPVLEQLRQVPGRDGYTSFMPMNNRTSYAVKQVMI